MQQRATSLKAGEGLDNEVLESMNATKFVRNMSDEGNGTDVTESVVHGRNETLIETIDLVAGSDDYDNDDHSAVEEHQAIDMESLDERLNATQVQSSEGMAAAANEVLGSEKIKEFQNGSFTVLAGDDALAFSRNDER
jgi:hypothetical protein